ncbi:MAG TPA: hypothetical protein VK388_06385 [Pyrinomonadaceae bacterium]|nr:hypothetical protein [Pyrinomonadaceae bacterium]
MAKDKDNEYERTPTAGKGGSPASSTPNEEARGASDGGGKETSNSRTPTESKESAGSKEGGGLH